jgi:hypothetical protein
MGIDTLGKSLLEPESEVARLREPDPHRKAREQAQQEVDSAGNPDEHCVFQLKAVDLMRPGYYSGLVDSPSVEVNI